MDLKEIVPDGFGFQKLRPEHGLVGELHSIERFLIFIFALGSVLASKEGQSYHSVLIRLLDIFGMLCCFLLLDLLAELEELIEVWVSIV